MKKQQIQNGIVRPDNENQAFKKLILIGGSAGGFQVASRILSELDEHIDAAVIVVLHLSQVVTDALVYRFSKTSVLPVQFAKNDDKLEKGKVYVAPPGYHCLIAGKKIRLTKGPRVNRVRPSIDLTFRSAAVDFNVKTIGVLVSGMRDDGVTGLRALKSCGGTAIIQDPTEAEYTDLPLSAKDVVESENILFSKDIAEILQQQARLPNTPEVPVPTAVLLENQLDLNNSDDISEIEKLGNQIPVTCTDCGGPLWEIKEEGQKNSHYRCHVGHVLSQKELLKGKDEHLEQSLWLAYRTLEEKLRMLEEMVKNEEGSGRGALSISYRDRANETKVHVEKLRKFLFTINESVLN